MVGSFQIELWGVAIAADNWGMAWLILLIVVTGLLSVLTRWLRRKLK